MEEGGQVNIEDFKEFNHKNIIDICNKSDSALFAYFQDIGILPKTRTCVCGSEMRHKVRPGRADAWRCKTKNCAKEIGYFKNTFFSNSNLDPREIFEFTYLTCLAEVIFFSSCHQDMDLLM
uniref:Uncharacterized protein n=1 Tax=Panagrolaimus davidi TaxID=227884 RepID=A0A914P1C6_9BILA